MGIEALSRGATWVDFVESNPRYCAVIRQNLAVTAFSSQAHVYCCEADKALRLLSGPYDVVTLNPPYADTSLADNLAALFRSGLVGPDSTVVVEYSSRGSLPAEVERFCLCKSRDYGDTRLSFYRQEANN